MALRSSRLKEVHYRLMYWHCFAYYLSFSFNQLFLVLCSLCFMVNFPFSMIQVSGFILHTIPIRMDPVIGMCNLVVIFIFL